MNRSRTSAIAIFLVSFLMVSTVNLFAHTLVYEGFDYTPGSDVTSPLAGGYGFADNWAPGQQGGKITVYDETAETVVNGTAGGELTWNGVVDNVPTSPDVGTRFIGADTAVDRITAQRTLAESAGALAGSDGVLWASIVWHQQGSNYGRHVGFVLGTDGISNRAVNCDKTGNFGAGIGDAIGVGGAFNTNLVTPVVFDDGAVAVRTTTGATGVSYTEDNLVVLKFEFNDGATPDIVRAYRFVESDTLSEATFDTNAVSASYVIDQDILNILSFSQSRGQEAIDEIRLGDTFDDIIANNFPPTSASGTLVYEGFDYTPGSDVTTPLGGGIGFADDWAPGQQGGKITVYDETAETVSNGTPGGELTWNGVVDNVLTTPPTGSRFIGTDTSVDRVTAQRTLAQNAGALAGPDGVLWASIVWHQEGYNYGRHVGFVLGTDGISNRSLNVDKSGNFGAGIGDAMGVGGAINTNLVTPVIFDDGAIAVRTTSGASAVSYSEDNLVVLKFEFADGGTPDTVWAYRFVESETPTEAAFNANAVSASYVVDQDTLNILSFSQSRGTSAMDEVRLGDTFTDIITNNFTPEISGGSSSVVASPTSVSADGVATSTVTVTMKTTTGEGAPDRQVVLENTGGVGAAVISPAGAQTTDANGEATFLVSSTTPGYEIFTAKDVTDAEIVVTQTAMVQFLGEPQGLFSVNFYAYGRGGDTFWSQESWRETVRLDPTDADQSAGYWETTVWENNFGAASGTITSDDGQTATFTRNNVRNSGPYWWTSIRDDSDSVDVGNATLLDGHMSGTEYDNPNGTGAPFPARIADFTVDNIPYSAYDLVVYISYNDGQKYSRLGRIRVNDEIAADPADPSGGIGFVAVAGEPTGVLDEVTSDGDTGNFIVYKGLTGPTLRVQMWGAGFTHLGPAGFQIRESNLVGDADASTVTASPASVVADGIETSTITVTVKTSAGDPVEGKEVTLANTSGPGMAVISPSAAVTTDANGVATFTVSSTTVGTEVFTATDVTDGVVITQTASVDFTIVPQTWGLGIGGPPPNPDAPQTSLVGGTTPAPTRSPEPGGTVVVTAEETPEYIPTENVIRVTEYALTTGDFGGTATSLVLDQALASDYFILVRGSRADDGRSMPDNDYARVVAVPGGRGGLADSGAADAIGLQRGAAEVDWEGVVTVVECLAPASPAGFKLVDAVVTDLSGTSGSAVCAPWGDADQVVPFGGYRGGGVELVGTPDSRYAGTSAYVRLNPGSNGTLNWERDGGGETLLDATMTTFVVEWGSEWTVQHAAVAGSNGDNGADEAGEYTTAAISPVSRANTWVWGTGIRSDAGIGDCAESCLVALGDGVNVNATESTVAVGSEYTDAYSFDVYALTHPGLAVDHRFKPDGDRDALDLPVPVNAAPAGARFGWVYNGCSGTSSRFPRPRFWSRYTADDAVTISRGYDGADFPAWIQGIDFSGMNLD